MTTFHNGTAKIAGGREFKSPQAHILIKQALKTIGKNAGLSVAKSSHIEAANDVSFRWTSAGMSNQHMVDKA